MTNGNDTANAPAKVHPWERAGLGKAPYRVVGTYESKYQACHGAPIQPGTSCDYCGQGIMYVCAIRSADGKEFKVGCDCVGRVYQECAGTDAERAMRAIWDKAREPMRKAERARRQARAAAQADAAAAQLADEDVREILAAEPHPTLHMANRGATLLGWCEYVLEHGGAAGKVRVAKAIAAAVKRAKDSEREMERDALRAEINAGTR